MNGLSTSVSSAQKMDGIYRRQRFIYDATRRYYLLGRDRLIGDLVPPPGGTVLEIGCGTARNLVVAAQRYPSARLYGVDVSEAMLQTARSSVARSGLEARIKLASADAASFDAAAVLGLAGFDRVFISYSLSMIPAWENVVKAALGCVAPEGALLIVDFGEFDGYPALFRRAQLAWLRRFSVKPIPSFADRLGAIADDAGFIVDAARLYGGYAVQFRLTRG